MGRRARWRANYICGKGCHDLCCCFCQLSYFNSLSFLQAIDELLTSLRPDVIPLVDALDFPDRVLRSNIGRYDGNVYEALYQDATKVCRWFTLAIIHVLQGKSLFGNLILILFSCYNIVPPEHDSAIRWLQGILAAALGHGCDEIAQPTHGNETLIPHFHLLFYLFG